MKLFALAATAAGALLFPSVATALTVADVPSNLYALQRNADIVALVTIADI